MELWGVCRRPRCLQPWRESFLIVCWGSPCDDRALEACWDQECCCEQRARGASISAGYRSKPTSSSMGATHTTPITRKEDTLQETPIEKISPSRERNNISSTPERSDARRVLHASLVPVPRHSLIQSLTLEGGGGRRGGSPRQRSGFDTAFPSTAAALHPLWSSGGPLASHSRWICTEEKFHRRPGAADKGGGAYLESLVPGAAPRPNDGLLSLVLLGADS